MESANRPLIPVPGLTKPGATKAGFREELVGQWTANKVPQGSYTSLVPLLKYTLPPAFFWPNGENSEGQKAAYETMVPVPRITLVTEEAA